MDEVLTDERSMTRLDRRISDVVDREYVRLHNFFRKHVADRSDADDIVQDVFYELIEAYRMMKPVEQVTAWLFRVARNRIIDLFRQRKQEERRSVTEIINDESMAWELLDLLPSPQAGPEAYRLRRLLLEELAAALDELPEEQHDVFGAHELMGYSFKQIAARTGVGVNTLLSRNHYAVEYLRERLRDIYDEFLKL
jgi:RNA polymerase sigma factor (sigma-70 family)